jgi:putative transcriptional regulator
VRAQPRGALGLVINKPSDINLKNLFDKVDLPLAATTWRAPRCFQGGPVQTERGFVLHEAVHRRGRRRNESVYASTMTIPGGLEMTTSKDVLEAMSTGAGPRKVLVRWAIRPGARASSNRNLAENSWLTVAADAGVIFDTPIEQRYDKALMLLGLQAWMLSPEAGHA